MQAIILALDSTAGETCQIARHVTGIRRATFFGHIGLFKNRRCGQFTHAADVFAEYLCCVSQWHMVLRPLGARDRGHNIAQIQMQGRGIDRRIIRIPPEAVLTCIGLDQRDTVFVASCLAQIAQGFAVNREEATGRTVFGCHICDGRAIGERHVVQTFAIEFDEFANHAMGAQHLHALQHQIRGGNTFDHGASDLEADNFGDQHRHGLPQHRGLGLDPADAPAQHGQTVDHRGVAVSADQRVGVGDRIAVLVRICPDGLRQIFKVYLMADACARRHDTEIVERLLAPFQECIALDIALVFAVHIHLEGAGIAELVDHHRVVDNQIDRVQRVDLLRVTAQRLDPVAHGRQIDDRGHAGEILHQHAGRAIGDLARVLAALVSPFRKCLDVIHGDGETAILEPQHVFQHHLQRGGQAGKITQSGSLRGGDRVIGNTLSADRKGLAGFGAVLSDGDGHLWPPSDQEIRGIAAPLLTYHALSIKGGRCKMYTIAHKKSCIYVTVTTLSRFLDWSFRFMATRNK